jgi:hypothetical protein
MEDTKELLTEIRNICIINFAEIQILKKALFEKLGINLPERDPKLVHPKLIKEGVIPGYEHYDLCEFQNSLADILKNLDSKVYAAARAFPDISS